MSKPSSKYTAVAFGKRQAIAYHAGLERSFQVLAEFPRIGTPTYDLKAGLYRFPHKSHMIFYLLAPERVPIARVLSARADFKRFFRRLLQAKSLVDAGSCE